MTAKAQDSLAEQIAQHLAERIIRGELPAGERIGEVKVTQALQVSRSSVREALLILQRRHLVEILPHRGAQVSALSPRHVRSLYELLAQLYAMLCRATLRNWREPTQLQVFEDIQQRLHACLAKDDIDAFVSHSFELMRAAFPFADNPFLQETLENLLPAVSRTYHLILERRRSEMHRLVETFDALLPLLLIRDEQRAVQLLEAYVRHNCSLVLDALADSESAPCA